MPREIHPERATAAEQWLAAYGAAPRHRLGWWLEALSVPLVVVGLVGLLWSLPVPAQFTGFSPALNWGTLFLMAAVVYYFILSINLALGLLPFVLAVLIVVAWLDSLRVPLATLAGALFTLAWLGKLASRRLDGRPLAPLRDLQLTMIGPLWLLAGVYRRLDIPY